MNSRTRTYSRPEGPAVRRDFVVLFRPPFVRRVGRWAWNEHIYRIAADLAEGVALDERGSPRSEGGAGIGRREFLRWAAAAGALGAVGGLGGLSVLGYVKGPVELTPEWEVAPGVVDYRMVRDRELTGPNPQVLRVAQWFDYWPGSFLVNFEDYMSKTYNMSVHVQWDIFTSNEELFQWISLGKRSYDVIFPSNNYVDLYKRAGVVYNLNERWLPNLKNINHPLVDRPVDSPWNRRGGPNGDLIALPYFWGTTGLGFRSDRIRREDLEAMGWEIFERDSYTTPGTPTVELVKRMRMLDEMTDVLAAGFKEAGWKGQAATGSTPTGLFPPDGPQWTSAEADPSHVRACDDWLLSVKPRLFDYNSVDVVPSLVSGAATVNQAWNGDIMYAKRPDQNTSLPVDYVIPPQGTGMWFDSICIHSKCRNLWLAHEFANFIHNVDAPWKENQLLTKWNLYATPNQACYDKLSEWEVSPGGGYPSHWRMTEEPILYPNVLRPELLRVCDLAPLPDLDVLMNVYNPLWFDLTTE